MYYGFHKILSCTTVYNIDNIKKCFLSTKSAYWNDSEASCHTKHWSNGCWKFNFAITEINYILKYIKLGKVANCNNILHYYCIFDQINKSCLFLCNHIDILAAW